MPNGKKHHSGAGRWRPTAPSCWLHFADRFPGSRRAEMLVSEFYNVSVSGTFCTADDRSGFFFAIARHFAKVASAGAASWFAPSRRMAC